MHTAEGLKKIEEIKVGDLVRTYDESGRKFLTGKVTELYRHNVKLLYKIILSDGSVLKTTWNHPFYVTGTGVERTANGGQRIGKNLSAMLIIENNTVKPERKGSWVEAKDLHRGNSLLNSRGNPASVVSVEPLPSPDITVYNFEVEGTHNYFVGEQGVLVHNYEVSAGSGRPVSQLFEMLKNFITFKGFNSDGEMALKKILAPNKSGEAVNERTEIEIGGTKMIREAGSDRITMMLQGGETFTLSGPKDLERIIDAAGNGKYGNSVSINNAADFNELLSRGVENYYRNGDFNYQFFDYKNNHRINASDLGKEPYPVYSFGKTKQITAADTIRIHPVTKEPLEYYDYGFGGNQNAVILAKDVDKYFLEKRKKDPYSLQYDLLCGQIACRHAAKISLLKAYGIINPNSSVLEVTSFLNQTIRNREKMSDQDMLDSSVKSDWAKLTGAHQLKYTSFAFSRDGTKISGVASKLPLDNSKVQEHLNKKNPLLVLGDFPTKYGTVSHVSLVTGCSDGLVCNFADGLGLDKPLPMKWRGDIYGVEREKK